MNMYLAVVLLVLAVSQVVALLAILFRYAVPRSPNVLHVVVVGPMLVSSGTALILGLDFLGAAGEVLGISTTTYLAVFLTAETATFSTLNAYAYYWHTTGRHKQHRPEEGGSA